VTLCDQFNLQSLDQPGDNGKNQPKPPDFQRIWPEIMDIQRK